MLVRLLRYRLLCLLALGGCVGPGLEPPFGDDDSSPGPGFMGAPETPAAGDGDSEALGEDDKEGRDPLTPNGEAKAVDRSADAGLSADAGVDVDAAEPDDDAGIEDAAEADDAGTGAGSTTE